MPWNGDMLKYREWRELLRDHLLGTNQGYGRILHEIEKYRTQLSMNYLICRRSLPGMNIDMLWITKQLWTFLVRHVNRDTRKSFKTLVDGEELNGAELWRSLFVNNNGGAGEVEVADLGALHAFPPCPSGADLPHYLGLWLSLSLVSSQGMDSPARHLTTRLTRMLHKEVLVRHVNRDTRKSFKTLVDGEELNGAELWRSLSVNNNGGAGEVEVADLGARHAFPPCPSGADLPHYLGLWLSLSLS